MFRAGIVNGSTIFYHYDLEGRLIAETDSAGVALKEYVWLGWRPIAMIVPDNNPPEPTTTTTSTTTTVHTTTTAWITTTVSTSTTTTTTQPSLCGGCSAPEFLLDLPWETPKTTPTQYFKVYAIHTDHLGTPIAMTDQDGTVVWTHVFGPFGETLDLNEDVDGDEESVTLNLRFPGQYYDAESGLNYNWWRFYDPMIGRYLAVDSDVIDGKYEDVVEKRPDLYGYASANPLKYHDINGRGWFGDFIKFCKRQAAREELCQKMLEDCFNACENNTFNGKYYDPLDPNAPYYGHPGEASKACRCACLKATAPQWCCDHAGCKK